MNSEFEGLVQEVIDVCIDSGDDPHCIAASLRKLADEVEKSAEEEVSP